VAEVAGLAIRAGFAAMIVPNTAADQRKNKQKRGQNCAELYGSNCAVLLHSQLTMPFPWDSLPSGCAGKANIQCTPDALAA